MTSAAELASTTRFTEWSTCSTSRSTSPPTSALTRSGSGLGSGVVSRCAKSSWALHSNSALSRSVAAAVAATASASLESAVANSLAAGGSSHSVTSEPMSCLPRRSPARAWRGGRPIASAWARRLAPVGPGSLDGVAVAQLDEAAARDEDLLHGEYHGEELGDGGVGRHGLRAPRREVDRGAAEHDGVAEHAARARGGRLGSDAHRVLEVGVGDGVAAEGLGVRHGRELGDARRAHRPGVVGRLEQRPDDVIQGHTCLGRGVGLDAAEAGEHLSGAKAEDGDVGEAADGRADGLVLLRGHLVAHLSHPRRTTRRPPRRAASEARRRPAAERRAPTLQPPGASRRSAPRQRPQRLTRRTHAATASEAGARRRRRARPCRSARRSGRRATVPAGGAVLVKLRAQALVDKVLDGAAVRREHGAVGGAAGAPEVRRREVAVGVPGREHILGVEGLHHRAEPLALVVTVVLEVGDGARDAGVPPDLASAEHVVHVPRVDLAADQGGGERREELATLGLLGVVHPQHIALRCVRPDVGEEAVEAQHGVGLVFGLRAVDDTAGAEPRPPVAHELLDVELPHVPVALDRRRLDGAERVELDARLTIHAIAMLVAARAAAGEHVAADVVGLEGGDGTHAREHAGGGREDDAVRRRVREAGVPERHPLVGRQLRLAHADVGGHHEQAALERVPCLVVHALELARYRPRNGGRAADGRHEGARRRLELDLSAQLAPRHARRTVHVELDDPAVGEVDAALRLAVVAPALDEERAHLAPLERLRVEGRVQVLRVLPLAQKEARARGVVAGGGVAHEHRYDALLRGEHTASLLAALVAADGRGGDGVGQEPPDVLRDVLGRAVVG
eukprot:scaffold10669_cov62-Phaeocystis_antarctica.AAC.3